MVYLRYFCCAETFQKRVVENNRMFLDSVQIIYIANVKTTICHKINTTLFLFYLC
jgi:hypothetical protein